MLEAPSLVEALMTEIDPLFDPKVVEDPHGYFARLRVTDPVHEVPGTGTYLVTRMDLIHEVVAQQAPPARGPAEASHGLLRAARPRAHLRQHRADHRAAVAHHVDEAGVGEDAAQVVDAHRVAGVLVHEARPAA